MSTLNTLAPIASPATDPVAAAFDRARERQGRVLIATLKPARLHRAPALLAAGADLIEVTGDLAPIAYALRQSPDLVLLPLVLRVERLAQPAHIPGRANAADVARLLRGARHYVAVEAPPDAGHGVLSALRARLRLVRALTRLPLAVQADGIGALDAAEAVRVDCDAADVAAIAAGLARPARAHLRAV